MNEAIYEKILRDVLNSAEKLNYKGYSKFDALNSGFLNKITFENKWLRFIYIQTIKECPINIRPIFNIEKSKNPKGIALFSRAYSIFYEKTGEMEYLQKSERLIEWLLNHSSSYSKKYCWGYNFIWQSTLFYIDKYKPNLVVTVFVGEALIHIYGITKKIDYLYAAISAAEFIMNELPVLYQSSDEMAIAYIPGDVKAIVLNNQILAGSFLIKVWKYTQKSEFKKYSELLMNYTINRRTAYHAWYYTYPNHKSNISHDNYHTGGILDGILEYFEMTNDSRYLDIYFKGLDFYLKNLFEINGAPRWMNDKRYPYDIHGAAQGIISFKKASKYDFYYKKYALQIANWAILNLYKPKTKEFAYRRGRYFKWNYSLMRWCNAWMARAMAELIS